MFAIWCILATSNNRLHQFNRLNLKCQSAHGLFYGHWSRGWNEVAVASYISLEAAERMCFEWISVQGQYEWPKTLMHCVVIPRLRPQLHVRSVWPRPRPCVAMAETEAVVRCSGHGSVPLRTNARHSRPHIRSNWCWASRRNKIARFEHIRFDTAKIVSNLEYAAFLSHVVS